MLGQITAARPSAAGPSATRGAAATAGPQEELVRLPLEVLQRGRYQPRVDLREESLQELAHSIRSQGVVQPIVVRPLDSAPGEPQRYEIVAGERRWRAAQLAALSSIPAVIRRIPDEAAIAVALIENIQRENLNPLEEARALDRLIREFAVTHQQAADLVGRSRAAVSNLLRLLELPPDVAALVESRQIEMGHARALLGLANKRQQSEVGSLVARKGLSVRETEALVRRIANAVSGVAARGNGDRSGDPNVERLERELAERLGAAVTIQHRSSGKGKLIVRYNSLDELDGILAHIH
ncbi:MAG: ParB/RepB/Spo0J family partition protein [Gammaproteobacteria bacterium]|nr:ParB/RepB/Spo0J family partition protein [Gammaproteobacteria bacterium]